MYVMYAMYVFHFLLDFCISMPWVHVLQMQIFHWISLVVGPWCEKRNSRPPSHAGARCPWTRFLEMMHAFQDSVLGFIQKRFSPDFIATVQWGKGSTRRNSSEANLERDFHPHDALPWCKDLAHFLLGLLLCMSSSCDSIGPVHTLPTFQLHFFFRKFFGVFVWGPAMSPKHLSWGGILCWAFKKTWL